MASTMVWGRNGGTKKSNRGEEGNWIWEKSEVRVKEGKTRVVRIPGVLYLRRN